MPLPAHVLLQSDPAQRPTARELYARLRECAPTDLDPSVSLSHRSGGGGGSQGAASSTHPLLNSLRTAASSEAGRQQPGRLSGGSTDAPGTPGSSSALPIDAGISPGAAAQHNSSGKWSFGSSRRSWASGGSADAAAAAAAAAGPSTAAAAGALEEGRGRFWPFKAMASPFAPQAGKPAAKPKAPPPDPLSCSPGVVNPALSQVLERVMSTGSQQAHAQV